MFRIAHLTDPHVGPLPRPRLRELLNKRLTGFFNWHRGRTKAHDMEILAALVSDMHDQEPHHIACTGDVANIGLPEEWSTARVFLEGLGAPDRVSFVPGNHDAYIEGALEGLLAVCGPWTEDDGGALGKFPYVRRRGHVALVGLSSAIPTAPFVASGRMGKRQMEATERLLARLGPRGGQLLGRLGASGVLRIVGPRAGARGSGDGEDQQESGQALEARHGRFAGSGGRAGRHGLEACIRGGGSGTRGRRGALKRQ